MHYKSEKKHSKKSRKLPKRMKGQESFFDDNLEYGQDESSYSNKTLNRDHEAPDASIRTPRRLKTDISLDSDISERPETNGQIRTSLKHGGEEVERPDRNHSPRRARRNDLDSGNERNTEHQEYHLTETRVPRRMKQQDFFTDYGQAAEPATDRRNDDTPKRMKSEGLDVNDRQMQNFSDAQRQQGFHISDRSSVQYPGTVKSEEPEEDRKYAHQRREKPIKRGTQRKKISGAWIMLICLGLLTLVSLLAWDIFKVSKVEINGLSHIPYADVVALSGIQFKQNVFMVDFDNIRSNIETNPILEVIDIRRVLPSTIIIDISERKAIAVLSYIGRTVVLDKDCNVVGISGETIPEGMMIVKGVEIKDYTLGREIVLHDVNKQDILKVLLSAFEDNGSSQYISEIDITKTDYIVLKSTMGLEIRIGSTQNLAKKCILINALVPQLHHDGKTTGVFHVMDINTAHYVDGQ